MKRTYLAACLLVLTGISWAVAADWRQFRGPSGAGISDEQNLPVEWTAGDVKWKVELPGPGASSPIVVGDHIFLTCYSGYGLSPNSGNQEDLLRHLLCLDRATGQIRWHEKFKPLLPEHQYAGEGSYHGYAASTPISDGQKLYVFFGKSGVYCYDLSGKQLWHTSAGDGIHGWGSGTSPILFEDLLIVNASVESNSLVALNKETGDLVWRAAGIQAAWNTPALVPLPNGDVELVVSIEGRLEAFNPRSGEPLWGCEGIHRYVCPSVVAHEGIVFATGGGHTTLAVRSGGRGDVTSTHLLWRVNHGSNVPSPIYYEDHLYWISDNGGIFTCQNALTGEDVYRQRLDPPADRVWASPLLADGKIYIASQESGFYVVAAAPQFQQLAHIKMDDARTNASPVAHQGELLLRNDRFLYCVGN